MNRREGAVRLCLSERAVEHPWLRLMDGDRVAGHGLRVHDKSTVSAHSFRLEMVRVHARGIAGHPMSTMGAASGVREAGMRGTMFQVVGQSVCETETLVYGCRVRIYCSASRM